jgi:hypothetical protein
MRDQLMIKPKWKSLSFVLLLSFSAFTLLSCSSGGSDSGGVNASGFTGGSGTAVLSWTPPTTNTDGSPADLVGFNIYAGDSASDLQFQTMVSALDTTFVVENLPTGTYFFAVTAVSVTGAESGFSNIESKTISPS